MLILKNGFPDIGSECVCPDQEITPPKSLGDLISNWCVLFGLMVLWFLIVCFVTADFWVTRDGLTAYLTARNPDASLVILGRNKVIVKTGENFKNVCIDSNLLFRYQEKSCN